MNEHARARALIARRFELDIDPGEQAWLFEHLMECSSCAHLHERYAQAERALERTEGVLTEGLLDRAEARLLPAPVEPPSQRRWLPAAGGLLAAAAAAGAMMLSSSPEPPELTARGGARAPQTSLTVLRVLPGPSLEPLAGSVSPDGRLLFLVGSTEGGLHRVEARWTDDAGVRRTQTIARGDVSGEGRERLGDPIRILPGWAGREVRFRVSGPRGAGPWVPVAVDPPSR